MSNTRFLLMALLVAGLVPAQTPAGLVGFGSLAVGPTGVPLMKLNPSDCSVSRCFTPMNGHTDKRTGGTAYDATRGAVWVSNGTQLACVDATTCRVICAPHTPPDTGATAQITGLAVYEPKGLLLATTTANTLLAWQLDCPIRTVVSRCSLANVIPNTHTVGGLAVDDLSGSVFYGASSWSSSVPANTVLVAPLANPCAPTCKFELKYCGRGILGPLTGLGFDACSSTLWGTDGSHAVGARFDPQQCAIQELRCCSMPAGTDRWSGMCILPAGAYAMGKNCTNNGCGTCTGMTHGMAGDPTVGNPAFGLTIEGAPLGAQGWLLVGVGPTMPPCLQVPPFCGPVCVPLVPTPWMLGPYAMQGTAICGGARTVTLPVPLQASLCGAFLSSQWVGLCMTGPFGTFVTHTLNWRISWT